MCRLCPSRRGFDMATLWVSVAAANGIPIGNDGTGAADNNQLPYLTFNAAEGAAGNGDTIYLNDGTHTVDGVAGGDIETPNLSVLGVTDYGATMNYTGGAITGRIIRIRATGCTLGKFIIDAGSNLTRAIEDASGPHLVFTVDGTYIRGDCTAELLQLDTINDITFKGGWTIQLDAPDENGLFITGATGGGTVDLSDGTIINQFSSNLDYDIYLDFSIAGYSVVIHDIDVQVSMGTLTTGETKAVIRVLGAATVEIYNITSSNSVITGNIDLVAVQNSALACTSCYIHDISASFSASPMTEPCSVVVVGNNDTTANDDSITGIIIENITVGGANHGILMGHVTGGILRKCRVDLCVLGIVLKKTTSSFCEGNIVTRCNNVYILNKEGTSDTIQFNTISMATGGYETIGIRVGPGDTATDPETPIIYNNIIHSPGTLTKAFDIESVSAITATVKYNNIYVTGAVPADAYTLVATDYATLTLFEAAQVTIADNTENDAALQSDYSILSTSSVYGIGVKTWGTAARPNGYNDPIPDFDIDPGAMVSLDHPFHPTNL